MAEVPQQVPVEVKVTPTAAPITIRLNVHLSADKPIHLVHHTGPHVPNPAVTAAISIQGDEEMANAALNVDQTGQASTQFEDDHGNTDAAPPAGYVPSYQSDNPAVLTVDPQSGQVTPVAEGTANVTDPITDANGQPIPLPSGQGNFAPASAPVTIGPGLAIQASEQVNPNP